MNPINPLPPRPQDSAGRRIVAQKVARSEPPSTRGRKLSPRGAVPLALLLVAGGAAAAVSQADPQSPSLLGSLHAGFSRTLSLAVASPGVASAPSAGRDAAVVVGPAGGRSAPVAVGSTTAPSGESYSAGRPPTVGAGPAERRVPVAALIPASSDPIAPLGEWFARGLLAAPGRAPLASRPDAPASAASLGPGGSSAAGRPASARIAPAPEVAGQDLDVNGIRDVNATTDNTWFDVRVGVSAPGTINQNGGVFAIHALTVGATQDGSYNLQNGTLSFTTGNFTVGVLGRGIFTQTGGTVTAGPLNIGPTPSSNGAYNLSGGSLSAASVSVAINGGTGAFNQTGGNVTANLVLLGGSSPGGTATYHLDGGTLAIGSLEGSGAFNFGGGTLRPTGSNSSFFTGLGTANVRNGGAIIDSSGFNITIGRALSHSNIAGDNALDGGLTKLGAGTLTLTGTNAFTGNVAINGGVLSVSRDANLGASNGAITFDGNSRLQVTGTTFTTLSRNLVTTAGGIEVLDGGNTLTASGTISGGGYFVKSGGGTLVLTGANTYAGGTAIDAGTLRVSADGNLGASSSNVQIQALATLEASNTFGTTRAFRLYNGGGTFLVDAGQTLTLGGVVSDSGALVKTGAGTLALTAQNTFTGGTTVSAGILQLGNESNAASLIGLPAASNSGAAGGTAVTIQNNAALTVLANATISGGGGTIDLQASSAGGGTGVAFSGGGSLFNRGNINGGASTSNYNLNGSPSRPGGTAVAFGGAGGSFTNEGIVTGGNAGIAFYAAPGLGGTGVSFSSGGTLINRGAINGGTAGASAGSFFGSPGGAGVSFGSAGSLANSGTIHGGTGGTGLPNSNAVPGTGGAGVSFANAGSLSNSGTIFGGVGGAAADGVIAAGGGGGAAVSFTNGGSLTNSGTINKGDGAAGGRGGPAGSPGLAVLFSGAAGTLGNQSGGLINGDVAMGNFANAVTLETGSTLRGALNLGTSTTATLTLAGTGTQAYSVAVTGATGFAGSLTKTGPGTWVLNQSFTYTGTTTVNAGTLALNLDGFSSPTAVAAIGPNAGTVTVANGAMLRFDSNNALGGFTSVSGPAVVVNGGTVASNNTYSQITNLTLNGGTLAANGGYAGFGAFSIRDTLTSTGTSSITATGPNAYLALSQAGSTTFAVNDGTLTIAAPIADHNGVAGSLTKTGAGSVVFGAASTYTGSTAINAGTLLAANASGSATGTGPVTVNGGATLGGNGTIFGTVTVASGGTLAPGAWAPSRLTLGSTLTLQPGSTLAISIGGPSAGSSFDQVVASGLLTLGGNLSVQTINGFAPGLGQRFTILENTDGAALTMGIFANTLAGNLYANAAGETFLVNYFDNVDGGLVPNDVTLTYLGLNAVPEPSTWMMLAAGLGLGLIWRRARHRNVAAKRQLARRLRPAVARAAIALVAVLCVLVGITPSSRGAALVPNDLVLIDGRFGSTGTPNGGVIFNLNVHNGGNGAETILASTSVGSGTTFYADGSHGAGTYAAVSPAGLIYYVDYSRDFVALDPVTLVRTVISGGANATLGPTTNRVDCLAWDFGTGTILYYDNGAGTGTPPYPNGGFYRLDPATGVRTAVSLNGGSPGSGEVIGLPIYMVTDPFGNLFYLDYVAGSSVAKGIFRLPVTTPGGRTYGARTLIASNTIGSQAGGPFIVLNGLAVDHSQPATLSGGVPLAQSLLVGDEGSAQTNSAIFRIPTNTGDHSKIITFNGVNPNTGTAIFDLPVGITVGTTGRAYYSEWHNWAINSANDKAVNLTVIPAGTHAAAFLSGAANLTIDGRKLVPVPPPSPALPVPTVSGTATVNGSVTADGGVPNSGIIARGFVYAPTATTSLPTIGGAGVTQVSDFSAASLPVAQGANLGTFSASPAGLALGTSYTVRAYAQNVSGFAYSAPVTFTPATAPSVDTNTVINITGTSATLRGNDYSDNGAVVTARGMLYSATNQNPVLGGNAVINLADATGGIGNFAENTGSVLANGTTYYVRAYATNRVGTSYGLVDNFTTVARPLAAARTFSVPFNAPKAVTLPATDPNSPALPLTYAVAGGPAHGTLSGTAPNLTYTPASNYQGPDRFTFTASNGSTTSQPATVYLSVAPGRPTLDPQSQIVNEGTTSVTFRALAQGLVAASAPDSLSNGATLLPEQSLVSGNHGYQLLYQSDCNLVLYRGDGTVLWATNTGGNPAGFAVMQGDGNFVVYDGNGVARFATDTSGNPGAVMLMQNDGNLVIYRNGGGPVFTTNTAYAGPDDPTPTVQWQVSSDGGATFSDIPGANALTLTFTPSVVDSGKRYRTVFANAGATYATAAATLTVWRPIQSWRALQGLPADGSQDLANPSGDGIPNLLKYAFNLAPNAGDLAKPNYRILPTGGTAGLPSFSRDAQGRLVIEFVRRRAASDPGITYTVEANGVVTFLPTLDLSGATVAPIDAVWERVTVTDPTITDERFGRVRVTIN